MNRESVKRAIKEVAETRGVTLDDVYDAIEDALFICAKKKFKKENDEIDVELDRDKLEVTAWEKDPETGERGAELPDFDFTRVGATIAKQILTRDISRAARREIIEKYTPMVGRLILGIVKNTTRQGTILNIGAGEEAIIPHDLACRGEKLREGDKVWGIISHVQNTRDVPNVVLSRIDPMLVVALLAEFVPEVERGEIEIVGIARMPGLRTKLLVTAGTPGLNAVATIIGPKGSTINQVSQELGQERIDVIEYVDDRDYLLREMFKPAKVINITDTIDGVIVEIEGGDKEMRMALGRGGANAVLAEELLNIKITVCTEKQAKELREQMIEKFIEETKDAGINEMQARTLFEEGFRNIYDVMLTDSEYLQALGIDPEKVDQALEKMLETDKTRLDELDTNRSTLVYLLECGFRCCEEIADKDIDEIRINATEEEKWNLILAAREACGMI